MINTPIVPGPSSVIKEDVIDMAIPLPDFHFATALFDINVPLASEILIIIGMFFAKQASCWWIQLWLQNEIIPLPLDTK
jgi:hypothetical protein